VKKEFDKDPTFTLLNDYMNFPSLLWFQPWIQQYILDYLPFYQPSAPATDKLLLFQCLLGALIAGLIFVGRLRFLNSSLGFAALFLLYLSHFSTGGVFMSFQWDILLLESGFLAIFLAPLNSFSSGEGSKVL